MAGFKNVIQQAVAAAAGFIASVVKPGISQTTVVSTTPSEIKPGIAMDASRVGAQVAENVGVATSLLGAVGDVAKPAMNAAIQQTTVADLARPQETPAFEIVQIKYDLNRRVGGNSVTETAVGGRTDWINDANMPGLHNGAVASITGNATGARGGQLELSYADSVNKGDLTITSAKLHFYVSLTGSALNNADFRLKYDIGAGFVTLETITGNIDNMTTPRTYDLTGILTTWTQYDSLRAACYADAAIAELWTANVDAVEVEIVATRTDTV